MKQLVRAAVAVVIIVGSRTARADDWINPYTGNHWNNPTSDLLDTMIRDQMNQDMLAKSLGVKKGGGTPATTTQPAPVKHLPYTKTDFAGTKKRLVVDAILSSLVTDAAQKQKLAPVIDQVFVEFEKAARKNNVAYALAFMVAASVSVKQGVTLTDEQTVELAAGINDILGQTSAFAKSSAKDRQKLYETFVTLGGLIMLFAEVGKQDESSKKAAGVLATQALAMVGVK